MGVILRKNTLISAMLKNKSWDMCVSKWIRSEKKQKLYFLWRPLLHLRKTSFPAALLSVMEDGGGLGLLGLTFQKNGMNHASLLLGRNWTRNGFLLPNKRVQGLFLFWFSSYYIYTMTQLLFRLKERKKTTSSGDTYLGSTWIQG